MQVPANRAANAEQFVTYQTHVRQRENEYCEQMKQRWQDGQQQAKYAATLLKQQFGVHQVWLFGSMVSGEWVHPESDIDLAVWGLSRDRYCEAVGTLLCEISGFNIDLIMLETAQPSLLEYIRLQGVLL